MEVESVLAIEEAELRDERFRHFMGQIEAFESEKEIHESLQIESNVVAIEITAKCYTNCAECYTDKRANPKGEHLSFDEIHRRLEWLQKHTNVHTIYFFGGEPLLHPQMNQIFALARNMGFQVEIITSGVTSEKISFENRNRQALYHAYEAGDINIELSFHPDRNRKAFKNIYRQLRKRAAKRNENLNRRYDELTAQIEQAREMVRNGQEVPVEAYLWLRRQRSNIFHTLATPALYSTMTLGPEYAQDQAKLIDMFTYLVSLEHGKLDNCNFVIGGVSTPAPEYLTAMYKRLQSHFADFINSSPFIEQYDFTWSDDSKFVFKIWGAAIVKKYQGDVRLETLIKRPKGNAERPTTCPSMRSAPVGETQMKLPFLVLRADGWLTFGEPSCIEMDEGLVNVRETDDPQEIYAQTRRRVQVVDKLIHAIDKTHNPNLKSTRVDDGNCKSCPFDSACRTCHRLKINRRPRPRVL